MKFSYKLIKKILPKVKSKSEVVSSLNAYSYETEDLSGDIFDVKIPANRFSDSASHIGICREVAAILNRPLNFSFNFLENNNKKRDFRVEIKEEDLCPRYIALRVDGVLVKESPGWIRAILEDCGLRSINNIVDIMNYVMLLTGQPLHAFDFDKLAGKKIIVRKSRKNEKILTLDDDEIDLDNETLVIADGEKPVAIAGIKGGKETGVDLNTKRILIEAANFNPPLIYKTYKKIGLPTDAAIRFSHDLSLLLPPFAIYEAARLIEKYSYGKISSLYDSLEKKKVKEQKVIKFDINKFNNFIGVELKSSLTSNILKRLGFKNVKNDLWKTPIFRLDINDHEDLFEEVARIYGYNLIPPKPPHLRLVETEDENLIALKEKLENILIGFGFTEAVSNSLIGKNDISEREVAEKNLFELENYISEEFKYLRPNLISGLKKITLHNLKFFNEVKLFEIGNVFLNKKEEKEREKTNLCVLSASKKENTFFELKGVISALLNRIGAFDFVYKEKQGLSKDLEILIDGKGVGKLGFLKLEDNSLLSFAEINLKELLKFIEEENEFKPLPKYPIVYRDISFLVDRKFKIGEIIESVSYLDKRIEDVDLIDEYFDKSLGENRQSLTLRLFLNPQDHTFSAEEIEDIMTNVANFIKEKFNAQIR